MIFRTYKSSTATVEVV